MKFCCIAVACIIGLGIAINILCRILEIKVRRDRYRQYMARTGRQDSKEAREEFIENERFIKDLERWR